MSDKAREAFEKWRTEENGDVEFNSYLVERKIGGRYSWLVTDLLWSMWQAAWNARHEDENKVREALRECLAWGKVFGPVIPEHQWDEMRDSQIEMYTRSLAVIHESAELPELPEPEFTLTWRHGEYRVNKPNVEKEDCFTADQLRAYGEQCARRPQVDLTDEEIGEVYVKWDSDPGHHTFAELMQRAIAADRAKNGRGG